MNWGITNGSEMVGLSPAESPSAVPAMPMRPMMGLASTNGMKNMGFNTMGMPNMSGSVMLKSAGTMASLPRGLKRSDLQKRAQMPSARLSAFCSTPMVAKASAGSAAPCMKASMFWVETAIDTII